MIGGSAVNRISGKRSLGDSIFSITNGIFMLLVMVVTLYPFLNTIAVSFNNGLDTIRGESISGLGSGRCKIMCPCSRILI